MATANDILKVAASQIGYSESPANSNRTKYGKWYGLDGEPWCDMFVSWCADQVGATDIIGKFAACRYHASWFKKIGRWADRTETPKPGWIVFFANYGVACHIGIVESVKYGTVMTIEGNTALGNNANGGQVQRRARTLGKVGTSWYILGYGIPDYQTTPIMPMKEGKMQCIIQPNGEGRLVYYDGVYIHPLNHPDEVEALQMVARATLGHDLPAIQLGSQDAPWASRLFEAVNRRD